MYVYNVAINTPFNNSIVTYSSSKEIIIGLMVYVPLRNKKVLGVVLERVEKYSQEFKLKEIVEQEEVKIDKIFFSKKEIDFLKKFQNIIITQWGNYYLRQCQSS